MAERRTLTITELRADPASRQVTGIAAPYGVLSSDLGGFREQIKPGAFTRSLKENPNMRALYNHDSSCVLGTTKAGTLALWDDPRGLAFRIDLPATSYAQDLVVLMNRGDVGQMSFGFFTRADDWSHDESENRIRTLLDVDLREISIVGDAAYPDGTEAALRSLEHFQSHQTRQAVERHRRLFVFASRRA
jgi:HK97 family phage prohead protease